MVRSIALDSSIEGLIDSVIAESEATDDSLIEIPLRTSTGSATTSTTTSAPDAKHQFETEGYLKQRREAAINTTVPQLHTDTASSIRQLRREYLHGLQHVHRLTDLAHAPDAFLYGNFRDPQPPQQEK